MVDIQSGTAEKRRKKKKKQQLQNIMSASATHGGHNEHISTTLAIGLAHNYIVEYVYV